MVGTVSAQAKNLAYNLFASICYHEKYLEDHLHKDCPFRQSPFFIDIPPSIKGIAQTAFPWTATSNTPKFTGIPPHVSLLASIEQLTAELAELRVSMKETIVEEFDDRGIGSTEFHSLCVEEKIADMMKRMEDQHWTTMEQLQKTSTDNLSPVNNDEYYDAEEKWCAMETQRPHCYIETLKPHIISYLEN